MTLNEQELLKQKEAAFHETATKATNLLVTRLRRTLPKE